MQVKTNSWTYYVLQIFLQWSTSSKNSNEYKIKKKASKESFHKYAKRKLSKPNKVTTFIEATKNIQSTRIQIKEKNYRSK